MRQYSHVSTLEWMGSESQISSQTHFLWLWTRLMTMEVLTGSNTFYYYTIFFYVTYFLQFCSICLLYITNNKNKPENAPCFNFGNVIISTQKYNSEYIDFTLHCRGTLQTWQCTERRLWAKVLHMLYWRYWEQNSNSIRDTSYVM